MSYLRSRICRKTSTSTTFEAIGWLQAWTLCKRKQLNPKVERILTTTFCSTQGKVIKQYVFRVKQRTSTTYLSLLTKLVQSKIHHTSCVRIQFDFDFRSVCVLLHVEKRWAKEQNLYHIICSCYLRQPITLHENWVQSKDKHYTFWEKLNGWIQNLINVYLHVIVTLCCPRSSKTFALHVGRNT